MVIAFNLYDQIEEINEKNYHIWIILMKNMWVALISIITVIKKYMQKVAFPNFGII